MKNAVNVKKIKSDFPHYIKAKEIRKKFFLDIDFRNNYINNVIEKTNIFDMEVLENTPNVKCDYGYTPEFGLYVFQSVFMKAFHIDLETFNGFETLEKLENRV